MTGIEETDLIGDHGTQGGLFSTGSISYAGGLSINGYDNDIARLTGNVLERFLEATPFEYPSR